MNRERGIFAADSAWHPWHLIRLVLVLAIVLAGRPTQAFADFVINPTFDSSITSNANSAILQADINTAVAIYHSLFTDNVTVSILFRYSDKAPNGELLGGTLAQSGTGLQLRPYSTVKSAITSDSKTSHDSSAVAHLPAAIAFPNNPTWIGISTANARALGFSAPGFLDSTGGTNGSFDGIVTINSGQPFQLDRTGGIASNKYDVMQALEHEIDEVLGLGSVLPNTTIVGVSAVRTQDLFRYSAPGAISLDSSGSASSYFSIDGGTTNLVNFNQNPGGDYGDWGSTSTTLVQQAFGSTGTQSDVSAHTPEAVALDVIGYDLVSNPEPSSWLLIGLGAASMALARGRRKPDAATEQPETCPIK